MTWIWMQAADVGGDSREYLVEEWGDRKQKEGSCYKVSYQGGGDWSTIPLEDLGRMGSTQNFSTEARGSWGIYPPSPQLHC